MPLRCCPKSPHQRFVLPSSFPAANEEPSNGEPIQINTKQRVVIRGFFLSLSNLAFSILSEFFFSRSSPPLSSDQCVYPDSGVNNCVIWNFFPGPSCVVAALWNLDLGQFPSSRIDGNFGQHTRSLHQCLFQVFWSTPTLHALPSHHYSAQVTLSHPAQPDYPASLLLLLQASHLAMNMVSIRWNLRSNPYSPACRTYDGYSIGGGRYCCGGVKARKLL